MPDDLCFQLNLATTSGDHTYSQTVHEAAKLSAHKYFVRQMIEQGELPALRSLLAAGKWLEVRSPSTIGSGAVWPTFLTGEDPAAHGIYSEWKWVPETMSLRRYEGHHLTPFWEAWNEQGISIGVFDVPFAPPFITPGISSGTPSRLNTGFTIRSGLMETLPARSFVTCIGQ